MILAYFADLFAKTGILAIAMLVGLAEVAAIRATFLAARAAWRRGRKVVAA